MMLLYVYGLYACINSFLIYCCFSVDDVSVQPTNSVKPTYLRHHKDWSYSQFFLAFLPLPFWSLMVEIVNQNLAVTMLSTKKNPVKTTSIMELIRFYGESILLKV